MKKLLDQGADGYYIKESPEYNFSDNFSLQNYKAFKITIEKCIKRKHLRNIYAQWENAVNSTGNTNKIFMTESNSMLEIAWNLINEEKYDFAFLTLFQILEAYTSLKYNQETNSLQLPGGAFPVIEEKGDKKKYKLKFIKNKKCFIIENCEPPDATPITILFKTSCLLAFMFKKDNEYLMRFGKLNEVRNKIAHDGAKGFATKDNLIELLGIICLIRKYP